MKVFVYWNVRRQVWSIRACEGESRGKVVNHASSFEVACARFRVSEAGRQRVIATKRKSVHAGIEGELVTAMYVGNHGRMDDPVKRLRNGCGVRYNPYKGPHFVTTEGNHPVAFAPLVQGFWDRTVLAHNPRWA